jgi:thioredoxin
VALGGKPDGRKAKNKEFQQLENQKADRNKSTEIEMGSLQAFTDANFEQEVLKSDIPVLVDFWAPWCGPCQMIGPVVEELAVDYAGKLKVGKMNVDENQTTAANNNVRGIPMLIIFKDGKAVGQHVGAAAKPLIEKFITDNS